MYEKKSNFNNEHILKGNVECNVNNTDKIRNELPVNFLKKTIQHIRLENLAQCSLVDSHVLHELLWLGVPEEADPSLRAVLWKLAMGYIPLDQKCREKGQHQKIQDYLEIRHTYFSPETDDLQSTKNIKTWRQIQVDIVRTHPFGYETVFSHHIIQSIMIRVLLLWAIRNPASGYVQGLNDVITPFIIVFLREKLNTKVLRNENLDSMKKETIIKIESECYWCFSNLLSRVQDNFIFGQPGVVRMISEMESILKRIANPLLTHLKAENIELFHVCFRWINCFLTRDLPLDHIIRLWDTYIAEETVGFSQFHVKVCVAFLIHWSEELLGMDFQQIHLFLQNLPTKDWSTPETESLLAKAFILKNLFQT